MNPQHSCFCFTTAQQRKLLFEIWEKTGSVSEACRKAHIGRATFYYWKPRLTVKGYGGLEAFESRAARQLNRKAAAIEAGGWRYGKHSPAGENCLTSLPSVFGSCSSFAQQADDEYMNRI